MAEVAERAEIDRLVAQLLSAFGLAGYGYDARWRAHLRDLRRIVAADYRGTVRALHSSGRFPVRSLVGDVRKHFPDFTVQPIQFDAAIRQRIARLGIRLRMQDYARQPPLRGFYHRDPDAGPIIWVNLVHPPGAVAASLGHELGHWYREGLLGSGADGTSLPFFNGDFAAHLTRADELFADVFPVLAAYPTHIAKQLFPTRGWREAAVRVARMDVTTLAGVRNHLRSNYGFDLPERADLAPPRRIYYLTSMLHFARLRWAVLEELDV